MVIVRIWEGLGNQLFQYAYARALALRTGQKVYLDISEYARALTVRKYGLNHFRIKLPVIECAKIFPFVNYNSLFIKDNEYFVHKDMILMGMVEERNCFFKEDLCNLKGVLYIKGWFQSEKYFREFQDTLRKELYPKEKIKVQKDFHNIMKYFNTVSVHIRRGDFQIDHNTLPIRYYQEAVKVISDLVADPYFIIFSDDIEWVKRKLNFGSKCLYIDNRYSYHDYEELLIMSSCKHNIIANSTFSWWGAWLNENENKIIVAPKKWFLTKIVKEVDLIPCDWIRI